MLVPSISFTLKYLRTVILHELMLHCRFLFTYLSLKRQNYVLQFCFCIKTKPGSQKSSENLRSSNVRAARERVSSPAATRRRISFFLLSSPRGKWCCALIGCRPLTWSSILQADAHWAGLSAQSGAPPVIPDTATCHTHTPTQRACTHECVLRPCASAAAATCRLHLKGTERGSRTT